MKHFLQGMLAFYVVIACVYIGVKIYEHLTIEKTCLGGVLIDKPKPKLVLNLDNNTLRCEEGE